MVAYNKFNQFTQDLCEGAHNFKSAGATYKVALSNTGPAAANKILTDITEISAANGYVAGGSASAMSDSTASGTEKVLATNVTFTASGGAIGPFQYIVVYCSSQATPNKPLVAWYDNASAVTLNNGDSFTVQFDGTNGFFTVA